MRHLDHTINITWVMQHLNVAIKYIDHSGEMVKQTTEVVTGKSTCIHQRRIFFQVVDRGRDC
jgi:tryptophan 2,3-dioxygenase